MIDYDKAKSVVSVREKANVYADEMTGRDGGIGLRVATLSVAFYTNKTITSLCKDTKRRRRRGLRVSVHVNFLKFNVVFLILSCSPTRSNFERKTATSCSLITFHVYRLAVEKNML